MGYGRSEWGWGGVAGPTAARLKTKAREGGIAANGWTGQKAGGQTVDQGKVTVKWREDLKWNGWLGGRSQECGCWFAEHEKLRHISVAKDL